jgi:hypothetical protein
VCVNTINYPEPFPPTKEYEGIGSMGSSTYAAPGVAAFSLGCFCGSYGRLLTTSVRARDVDSLSSDVFLISISDLNSLSMDIRSTLNQARKRIRFLEAPCLARLNRKQISSLYDSISSECLSLACRTRPAHQPSFNIFGPVRLQRRVTCPWISSHPSLHHIPRGRHHSTKIYHPRCPTVSN